MPLSSAAITTHAGKWWRWNGECLHIGYQCSVGARYGGLGGFHLYADGFRLFFGYAVVVYVLCRSTISCILPASMAIWDCVLTVFHQTGACFFHPLQNGGGGLRLYIVILVLQFYLFDSIRGAICIHRSDICALYICLHLPDRYQSAGVD